MKKVLALIVALTMMMSVSVNAFAANNFVSSVVQNEGPSLILDRSWLADKNGNVLSSFLLDLLSITTVSGKDFAQVRPNLESDNQSKYDAAQKKLAAAYQIILNALSIQSVVSDPHGVLSADKTYVCSGMFDVTFYDELQDEVDEVLAAGGSAVMTFDVGIASDVEVYVGTMCDEEWVMLASDKVVNNNDGSITITFEEFCPVMVVQKVEDTTTVVTSAQTSDVLPVYGMMAALCLMAAAGILVSLKKKAR